MGRRRKGEPPRLLRHKASGLAYYTVNGEEVYLGPWGSSEAIAAYRAMLDEWQGTEQPTRPAPGCTVAALRLAFEKHAAGYYGDSREYTDYINNLKLLDPYSEMRAEDFRPAHLKEIRDRLLKLSLTRQTINKRIRRLRHVWGWGVEEELVSEDAAARLYRIKPLQRSRTAASEQEPAVPVPLRDLAAVLAIAPEPVRTMLRIAYYCGARMGEVCRMRGDEISTTGVLRVGRRIVNLAGEGVWLFSPARFKQRHRGKTLIYVLGPRAQRLLRPWLLGDGYLFSPALRMAEFRRQQRAARKTKVQPSQQDRKQAAPRKQPGDHYRVDSLTHAVAALCERVGVESWGVSQLRHNFATRLDEAAGVEVTSEALGHSGGSVAEVHYIARRLKRVAEVLRRLG